MTLEEFKLSHKPSAKMTARIGEEAAWLWLYRKSVSATGRKLTEADRKKQSDGLKKYHQTSPKWAAHKAKLFSADTNERRRKACSEIQGQRIQPLRKSIHANWGFRIDLGCSFMSSWEANVARWFRFMGIDYLVEPYSFQLGEGLGYYRPDFYLPKHDLFLEVKGLETKTYLKKVSIFQDVYPWVSMMVLGYKGYHLNLRKQFQDVVPNWEKTTADFKRLSEQRRDGEPRNLGTYTKQGESSIPLCLVDYLEKPRYIGGSLTAEQSAQGNTEATRASGESVETTREGEAQASQDIVQPNSKSLEAGRNDQSPFENVKILNG